MVILAKRISELPSYPLPTCRAQEGSRHRASSREAADTWGAGGQAGGGLGVLFLDLGT